MGSRRTFPIVPAAALYAIYGVYAMPWIGVLALLAVALLAVVPRWVEIPLAVPTIFAGVGAPLPKLTCAFFAPATTCALVAM